MEAGRVSQKRRFPKAMLLENSQVNLQHGRCKLMQHRYCMESPPSMAVLKMYILVHCSTTSFSSEKLAPA